MKLQLALWRRSPAVEALEGDIKEMEGMLNGYLAFARGAGSEESTETVDVPTLLDETAESARRAGGAVTIEAAPPVTVTLRPGAMRRALDHLAGTALRRSAERPGWKGCVSSVRSRCQADTCKKKHYTI